MPDNNEGAKVFDLLPKDVLLMPANYLFNSESVKFQVNFTNKNRDAIELNAENLASIAATKDQLIKCSIRKILADDLAVIKIEIGPGKFLYAELKITSKNPVTGISIFRYVAPKDIAGTTKPVSSSILPTLTPSSPSGSRPISYGLSLLFSKGSSGSQQLIRKWHNWNLSTTSQDVVQMLQVREPFSAFNLTLDVAELEDQKRLVIARRKLLNFEKFSDEKLEQWTDSKIIKEFISIKLKSELANTDVIPNLFEGELTQNIKELLDIYKVIGSLSEMESDFANIYEAILQSMFPQNPGAVVIGNIIAAWSHDKDKIENLIHKTSLMDLLSVLNMVCINKEIIDGAYRDLIEYPKMILAAKEVVTYNQKQDNGAESPTQTHSKSVIAKDMDNFKRRFEKLRKRAPQIKGIQLHI